jgi:phosphatidate cytidylyltransferase
MDDRERDGEGGSDQEEPTALRSGQVRIIGAEPVGKGAEDDGAEASGPVGSGSGASSAGPEALPPWPVAGDDLPTSTELPHWTEAPTGEVPAALARSADDQPGDNADPWSSLPAPTWREEHADWTAHDETFEPSMLAQSDARLGSLDDSGRSDRQPWSFDLLPSKEAPQVSGTEPADVDDRPDHDQDTMVVPVVRRPLAAEEPEEVAFRFDEDDEEDEDAESQAAPVVLGGTPATQNARGPADDEPRPAADEPAGARTPTAPPVTIADEPDALGEADVTLPGPAGLAEPGEPRGRRGGRVLGRPARHRGGPAHEPRPHAQDTLAQVPQTGGPPDEPTGARGLDDPGGAAPPRPAVQERPVPHAPEAGDGLAAAPAARPVPPAPPGPRRPAPRPRPGSGLRPPEPSRDARSDRNLAAAVASGLVLGIVALVFFKLGTITAMIVTTTVVTLAAMEVYAAFRSAGYRPATLLGLVATVSLMVATYNKGQEALPLVLVLVVAFTMLWHLAGVDRGAEPVRSTASTLLAFCWIGVFGSFAALLLDPTLFPSRHGIAFLLGAVITAVAYDIGALAVGAWVGSHPLTAVSPGKTWEGLFGGTVAALLVAGVVVHLIHPWTVGSALTLGVVVAVVSPIGDLSESLVKRHLGLKDMGRILPGHGGLLDRVDGMLFVLPATYYLVKAFHLG